MVEKNQNSKKTGQNSIEFDGKIVKPNKSGFYKCPFNCGDPRYPKPKWKTEKGFRQHMEKCSKRPSFISSKIEKEKNDLELIEKMKLELLTTLPFKVGDKIICINDIYSFEKDKEYSIEFISNYIIGNLQVFVQDYFSDKIEINLNIVNTFLKNFKIENN